MVNVPELKATREGFTFPGEDIDFQGLMSSMWSLNHETLWYGKLYFLI